MTTIYDSFNEPLPTLRQYGNQVETNTKSSGTTTAGCTPPRCGIRIPENHWIGLASNLCLDQHTHHLRSKQLPEVLQHIGLKSEADVVRASTLYLTYPVCAAYELVHQSGVQFDQLTIPQKDGIPASRVDMAYLSGPPSDVETPGNSNNVFALMEYKKSGGLSRYEFNSGVVTNADDYGKTMENPLFEKNGSSASMILQQATHYAGRYKTPFIALCDYNTLVLLVMDKVERSHGGQYTFLTVVTNSAKMRKAYLGFLLAAKLHAQKNNTWRNNPAGEDVFLKAENWEQDTRPSDAKPNPPRSERNSDPVHDVPSSQESASFNSLLDSD